MLAGMTPDPGGPAASCLATLFQAYPILVLRPGDDALYRRFRSLEPGLVSCLDGGGTPPATHTILGLHVDGQPGGILSLVMQANRMRPPPADHFGRIDLVIVAPHLRGLGLGRVLVLAGLVHLMEQPLPRLYSISCLAAHAAIARVLESLGFTATERRDRGFVHEELRIDQADTGELIGTWRGELGRALRAAAYRARGLRQQQRPAGRTAACAGGAGPRRILE
jgi:GNAT superfamily N-acetyltransferase